MSDTHVKLAVDQAQVISPTAIDGVESTTPSSHRWMQETLEENMRMAVETSYTADNAIMNMHVLDEWTGTIRNIEWLVGMVENVADVRGQSLISALYQNFFSDPSCCKVGMEHHFPHPQGT